MQGYSRKVVHATLFELIAIVLVTVAMQWVSDKSAGQSGGLAVSTSLLALGWNMLFNTLFERWERRQASRERTVRRRIAHTVLFEAGLVVTTVPLIAWWLDMGWWEAAVTDLGLVGFFLVYGFGFNWVFDHVFGVPDSARQP
jgi:uncharacterized membrane protein